MAALTRWAAGLEYRGGGFQGWQEQPAGRTVQGCLEAALSAVAGHAVAVQAAGRTDAGVHAQEQVVHFDSTAERDAKAWVMGANAHADADLAVAWAVPAAPSFHARHSALARRYRYRIHNRRSRSALSHGASAWVRHPLDAEAMHAAAQCLLGEHDFSAFRAAHCQSRTPMRFLSELTVVRRGDEVIVEVEANAFLHHMVRNLVGSLMLVGLGRQAPAWIGEVLAAGARTLAGPTAPAEGLYLLGVRYPERFAIPSNTMPALPPMGIWAGAEER